MSTTARTDKSSRKEQKTKKAKPSSEFVEDVEDSDEDIHYEPPEGAVLLNHEGDAEEFDYDALKNDDDLEIWVMRIPNTIKPKYLDDFHIPIPSSSHNSKDPLGTLVRKNTTYNIWSIDPDSTNVGGTLHGGAEELLNFSCLLPRKKKDGKLYLTPEPFTRHLVMTAALPSPEAYSFPRQNPPRYCHPPELLKHRFLPTGSNTKASLYANVDPMELDNATEPAINTQESVATDANKGKEKKKRKVESDTPKKSKKQKILS